MGCYAGAMRSWLPAIACTLACSSTGDETPASGVEPHRDDVSARAADAQNAPVVDAQVAQPAGAWTFAVLSDLHLPNHFTTTVDHTVAALIAMKVRFVVITGDHTNGSPLDGPMPRANWWAALTQALQPLREAGIPVLPVAGNHDSYLPVQREGYAAMFDPSWAKPLVIHEAGATKRTRWPFSYSVEVDGVHLSLAHVVATRLDDDVARWLATDLERASKARHRIAFGHVPLSSVIVSPSKLFVAQLGTILERGKVGLYAAGHEHLLWDEDVALPGGAKLRQLIVGCASGYYAYAPSDPAKLRAKCVPVTRVGQREPMRCQMPNGGAFEIARGRKNRHLQHRKHAFMLVDVDAGALGVRAMTIDADGRPQPFYLD
jgi:predicted phosphodiesterase